jgi:hypothetical protein
MKIFSSRAIARHFRKTSTIASILIPICFAGVAQTLYGQAEPTATRSGNLQIGGTFDLANSDYAPNRIQGMGFYSVFDFRYHLGFTTEFRQINDSSTSMNIYERTYEFGPRYVLHFGRLEPFVQVMYGRGVFNFPSLVTPTGKLNANLAYNLGAVGVGADYRLRRSINLRAEYEFQDWMGFPPHGLTPAVLDFGAAYHFH